MNNRGREQQGVEKMPVGVPLPKSLARRLLGCSAPTIYKMIEDGRLKSIRLKGLEDVELVKRLK